ncbi:MAG TPA: hypothetical protein VFY49_06625 [Myxococcota bacterium]|nr:hypothetical protein [Myxococcota bacterium]
MKLSPGLLIATVPIVWIATLPFVAAAVVVLRVFFSRWPPGIAWWIPLGVAAVGTLPGMVGVHRNLFPGYSYLDNVPFSLASLVVIATLAMAHAQLRPLRVRDTTSVALIAASAVNAAFPWWPLD